VAAALARIWNFPEPIILALQSVPLPMDATEFSEAAAWVHMGAWRARAEVMATPPEAVLASYPAEIGKRLGLQPDWVALDAAHQSQDAMPALTELTEGLEAMLS
jgi:hypothetical protein